MLRMSGDKNIGEQYFESLGRLSGFGASTDRQRCFGTQFQSDIFGEAMDALYLCNKYVRPISYDFWDPFVIGLTKFARTGRPGQGIWEFREKPEHFVYSKVMNWVALNRGIRLAEQRSLPANRRDGYGSGRIYEDVMAPDGARSERSFIQAYGNSAGCVALIMPLVFFWRPTIRGCLGRWMPFEEPHEGGLFTTGWFVGIRRGL